MVERAGDHAVLETWGGGASGLDLARTTPIIAIRAYSHDPALEEAARHGLLHIADPRRGDDRVARSGNGRGGAVRVPAQPGDLSGVSVNAGVDATLTKWLYARMVSGQTLVPTVGVLRVSFSAALAALGLLVM